MKIGNYAKKSEQKSYYRKVRVADVTAVGSLDRAERAISGVFEAGRVFGQSRSFLWSGNHFVV